MFTSLQQMSLHSSRQSGRITATLDDLKLWQRSGIELSMLLLVVGTETVTSNSASSNDRADNSS